MDDALADRASALADDLVKLHDEYGLLVVSGALPMGSDKWLTVTVRAATALDEESASYPGMVVEESEGAL